MEMTEITGELLGPRLVDIGGGEWINPELVMLVTRTTEGTLVLLDGGRYRVVTTTPVADVVALLNGDT